MLYSGDLKSPEGICGFGDFYHPPPPKFSLIPIALESEPPNLLCASFAVYLLSCPALRIILLIIKKCGSWFVHGMLNSHRVDLSGSRAAVIPAVSNPPVACAHHEFLRFTHHNPHCYLLYISPELFPLVITVLYVL